MATHIRDFFRHLKAKKDDAHKKPVVRSSGTEKDHVHEEPVVNSEKDHAHEEPVVNSEKDHAHEEPVVNSGGGGFGVKIAVARETPTHVPVVSRSPYGNGGVQGLKWYAEKLQVDDDGDVAQEFLSEVTPDCVHAHHEPGLESVAQTKPAVSEGLVSTQDGNVHQDC